MHACVQSFTHLHRKSCSAVLRSADSAVGILSSFSVCGETPVFRSRWEGRIDAKGQFLHPDWPGDRRRRSPIWSPSGHRPALDVQVRPSDRRSECWSSCSSPSSADWWPGFSTGSASFRQTNCRQSDFAMLVGLQCPSRPNHCEPVVDVRVGEEVDGTCGRCDTPEKILDWFNQLIQEMKEKLTALSSIRICDSNSRSQIFHFFKRGFPLFSESGLPWTAAPKLTMIERTCCLDSGDISCNIPGLIGSSLACVSHALTRFCK